MPARRPTPPLEPGDHLTRDEFERRFDATPGLKRAELIEGRVHMPPALRWDNHARPHRNLLHWVSTYELLTPGVLSGVAGSIRLDLDNEPQPDVALLIDPKRGGNAKISDDDYIEGAPELVAEISASTVSIDMHMKRRVYLRNGVSEYVVWGVYDGAIDWFALRESDYQLLPADSNGIIRSVAFPGLWLDAIALLSGDLVRVLRVLQDGITTPEHTEFVNRLAK